MRILTTWDDPAEAELITLYLNTGDDEATVVCDSDEFLRCAHEEGPWDVALMTTSAPTPEQAWETFNEARRVLPDCPFVGACNSDGVFRIARFMTSGLRAYVIRDGAGDFIFLLRATLESAVEAVRAEREKLIAERLREEVESVRKLQESIIPRDLECPPGYDVCARYESSQIRVMGGRSVVLAGGDYYDVFMLDDNTAVLILGDASGHGMKACMSIMAMHTLIRMIQREQYRDTASFVAQVNEKLCQQQIVNDDGGFITMLFGILRADKNEFQWTAAGHPSPLLQNLETNQIETLGSLADGGLPLGLVDDADYQVSTAIIPPGSRLLLYTDGLEEAFPDETRDHAEFGRAGIERSLQNSRESELNDALQALFDDSHNFTGGAGRHDDTSVLLLEHHVN